MKSSKKTRKGQLEDYISDATLASLALKANIASPTFTGKVVLPTSTAIMPGLILPNGVLSTTPQNGAIERDSEGVLWETHSGVRSQLVPTRFSKNIDPGAGTNFFMSTNSIAGEIIPANIASLSGKIYPSGLNSNTSMNSGDIIESSFIINRTDAPATANYIFRISFWNTTTSGGTPTVQSTYNYAWDTVAIPTLSVKIIFTKRSDLGAYGYLVSYVVLINGVFVYSTANFYSWDKADCRLFLVNNNPGTNWVVFNQHQTTNLFIPKSQSL